MFDLSLTDIRSELHAFQPDIIVITTAPTYLFWRCAPPELRVPQELALAARDLGPTLVAVGPHGSTTPTAALKKLAVDIVVMGECEQSLLRLANGDRDFAGLCFSEGGAVHVNGGPQAVSFNDLPALAWPDEMVRRHHHHHHRFEAEPSGPGAEVEASRGCPYQCTFCAKFGVQTRIDLWKPEMLELLGRAGCVSIEAGIESLTPEGRAALAKNCRMTTEQLADRLVEARRHVPFVQANLIEMPQDDDPVVQRWRRRMQDAGVWANDPVPLYPYPGSPDYRKLWGEPDEFAWERAHTHYLAMFDQFSDVQEQRPAPLTALEIQVAP